MLLAWTGGGGAAPVSFDGSLSASGSTATVTGTTRTATVPAANSGELRFESVTIGDTGSLQYSKNGGAWTAITEAGTVTLADSDTLAIRGVVMTSPETDSFNLIDVSSGLLIEAVTITRT